VAGEVIEFVDSVSASATVRLSLTTAPWRVLFSGTRVPPPPLRRAVAQTLLQDGAHIPGSAYDNRLITLRLQHEATSATSGATAVQLLNRELDRETNILRWQPESAIPAVYFRTFRSPDYDPDTDHGLDLWEMTVQLVAEPFALGLPVTVTPIAVANDPAAGSNGKFFDVTSVQGDVETPLLLKVPGTSVTGKQSLVAVRRRGTPGSAPFLLQCESMTQSTDTATLANNAIYSGSGNNSSSVSFSTVTTSVVRLSTATFPSSPSVDTRGLYRVFLRCWGANTGASFGIQLRHGVRAVTNTPETVVTQLVGGTYLTMADLGLVQLPEGFDPVTDGPTGIGLQVNGIPLSVLVRRISGSGAFIMDYLLFVPADDSLGIVKWGTSSPSAFVFNGISRSVYGLDASGRVADVASAGFVGGPPMVSPGVTNRVTYINDVSPQNTASDLVTASTTVSPFYWPRYLSVRPTST
jgi:hypothetical protein